MSLALALLLALVVGLVVLLARFSGMLAREDETRAADDEDVSRETPEAGEGPGRT